MKTKTRVNTVSGCSFEEPFERFARDFLRFTVDKLVVDAHPPCVGLLIMSDEDAWSRLLHVIEPHGSHELGDAKAVAIYVPLTLAQRVRLASELQRVCPGEYDKFLDYDALICVPQPKFAGNRLRVVVGFFYAVAASCMRLAIFARAGRGGVSVVTSYDKVVVSTLNDFFNTLTDDEIATRYMPEVP
jgi:hypothetical protein